MGWDGGREGNGKGGTGRDVGGKGDTWRERKTGRSWRYMEGRKRVNERQAIFC